MPFTIDTESNQNQALSLDLDYMSERYLTETGLFSFPSPSLWVLEQNLYFLLRNSTKKTFESKYEMRPDYLSYDEYGTVVLAPLLMYVNGIFTIEDFTMNEVVIPSFSYILEIVEDRFISKDKPESELEAVDW